MKNNSSKLLFFDIDGTLWDFNNNIPQSAVQALKLAQKNGHKVLINSGRARGYINHPNLISIGFDGIVAGCGTTIEYEDELIFKEFIDPTLLAESIDIAKSFGFRSILEGYDTLYLDKSEWVDDIYYKKLYRDLGDSIRSYFDDWGKWTQICKFSCDTTGADMEGGMKALSEHFRFIIHNQFVVEVVPKGFGKHVGIKYLCDYLNIDVKDTFAFGDSSNDMDMINFAGVGVAMGNGTDEIKEAADYVTTPMREDGIYNALKHFGLI